MSERNVVLPESTFEELLKALIAAERNAAGAERAADDLDKIINRHHRVPPNTALPANCQHCGRPLVRDFR